MSFIVRSRNNISFQGCNSTGVPFVPVRGPTGPPGSAPLRFATGSDRIQPAGNPVYLSESGFSFSPVWVSQVIGTETYIQTVTVSILDGVLTEQTFTPIVQLVGYSGGAATGSTGAQYDTNALNTYTPLLVLSTIATSHTSLWKEFKLATPITLRRGDLITAQITLQDPSVTDVSFHVSVVCS